MGIRASVLPATERVELEADRSMWSGVRGLHFHVALVPGTGLEPELERRGYTPNYASPV
jgi:hypothetical protein